jgi:hypothetical protein
VIAAEPVQTPGGVDVFAVPAPLRARSRARPRWGERELEIVVLRHQLAILRRGGKRSRYTAADRALLAAVSLWVAKTPTALPE